MFNKSLSQEARKKITFVRQFLLASCQTLTMLLVWFVHAAHTRRHITYNGTRTRACWHFERTLQAPSHPTTCLMWSCHWSPIHFSSLTHMWRRHRHALKTSKESKRRTAADPSLSTSCVRLTLEEMIRRTRWKEFEDKWKESRSERKLQILVWVTHKSLYLTGGALGVECRLLQRTCRQK